MKSILRNASLSGIEVIVQVFVYVLFIALMGTFLYLKTWRTSQFTAAVGDPSLRVEESD